MQIPISIKLLDSDDLSEAEGLYQLWKDPGTKENNLEDRMAGLLKSDNFFIFIAQFDNKVVGGLTAYTLDLFTRPVKELFLYEIEVLKEFRNKGIGGELLRHLVTFARAEGIDEIFVFADMANIMAQNFYKSHGGIADPSIMYSIKVNE